MAAPEHTAVDYRVFSPDAEALINDAIFILSLWISYYLQVPEIVI